MDNYILCMGKRLFCERGTGVQKKMALIVVVICVVIGISILAIQKGGVTMIFTETEKIEMSAISEEEATVDGRELMGMAKSEEEAKEIAKMYGIVFVQFADGIAEYTTDRPVDEIIAEGVEKGYPKLSINYIRKPMN